MHVCSAFIYFLCPVDLNDFYNNNNNIKLHGIISVAVRHLMTMVKAFIWNAL